MSRKRENVFIGWVHSHLPRHIYAEKTNNPFRRGTPDCYYESARGILWAEYKWIDRFSDICAPTKIKDFTKLQQRWLQRAHNNGIAVALIIGSPDGVVICDGLAWEQSFKPHPITQQEAVQWISKKLS